jgi:hypothetical protein
MMYLSTQTKELHMEDSYLDSYWEDMGEMMAPPEPISVYDHPEYDDFDAGDCYHDDIGYE